MITTGPEFPCRGHDAEQVAARVRAAGLHRFGEQYRRAAVAVRSALLGARPASDLVRLTDTAGSTPARRPPAPSTPQPASDAAGTATQRDEYRRISEVLQAAMLPAPQDTPTIAARSIPSDPRLTVSGSWYDVVDLDDHCRALIVGDCEGDGLHAATVMAQLRAAARAMLLDGRPPSGVLAGLDSFAEQLPGAVGATSVCVIYDRATRRLTYASAGHPPALLVGPDRRRWLDDPVGPGLGVPHAGRVGKTIEVAPDHILVLYTDGLVERLGVEPEGRRERFADLVETLRPRSANLIADELLATLLATPATDDVVVVVKQLVGETAAATD